VPELTRLHRHSAILRNSQTRLRHQATTAQQVPQSSSWAGPSTHPCDRLEYGVVTAASERVQQDVPQLCRAWAVRDQAYGMRDWQQGQEDPHSGKGDVL